MCSSVTSRHFRILQSVGIIPNSQGSGMLVFCFVCDPHPKLAKIIGLWQAYVVLKFNTSHFFPVPECIYASLLNQFEAINLNSIQIPHTETIFPFVFRTNSLPSASLSFFLLQHLASNNPPCPFQTGVRMCDIHAYKLLTQAIYGAVSSSTHSLTQLLN